MDKFTKLNEQTNESAEKFLNDVKAVSKNIGEVKKNLEIKLKEAIWNQDTMAIEVIKRAAGILKKEVDTIHYWQ